MCDPAVIERDGLFISEKRHVGYAGKRTRHGYFIALSRYRIHFVEQAFEVLTLPDVQMIPVLSYIALVIRGSAQHRQLKRVKHYVFAVLYYTVDTTGFIRNVEAAFTVHCDKTVFVHREFMRCAYLRRFPVAFKRQLKRVGVIADRQRHVDVQSVSANGGKLGQKHRKFVAGCGFRVVRG